MRSHMRACKATFDESLFQRNIHSTNSFRPINWIHNHVFVSKSVIEPTFFLRSLSYPLRLRYPSKQFIRNCVTLSNQSKWNWKWIQSIWWLVRWNPITSNLMKIDFAALTTLNNYLKKISPQVSIWQKVEIVHIHAWLRWKVETK